MASSGLGAAAARGAVSTAVIQIGRVFLQVVSVAVLARLLKPSDYGLFAMAVAVIGLGHMFRDMGLFTASVRAPELSSQQRDNLFWLNTALGAGFGLLCAAIGPLLSALYGHPELSGIALGLAPSFLVAGMATQYRVTLFRELRFGLAAGLDLLANVVGVLIAVAAAAAGWGYWALVLQQSLGGLCYLVAVVWAARWLPGRFRRHQDLRPMMRLGGSVMVSGLLTYVAQNVDTITVGARFGATDTGLYNRGVQLVRASIKQLESPIGAVSLPVMSRLQSDPARMLEFARRVQMSLNYPVLLVVAVVVAVPRDVVRVGLGDQWTGSSPVVLWIAVGTGLQILGDVVGMLLVARGLSGALARISTCTALLTIAGVVTGAGLGGTTGVAIGYAVASALAWPLGLVVLRQASGLDVRGLAVNAVRTLVVATVAGTGARLVDQVVPGNALLGLVVATAVVGAVLGAVALVVPTVRSDVRDLLEMARTGLRRREPDPVVG